MAETAQRGPNPPAQTLAVEINAGTLRLPGDLNVPASSNGIVVFAHGSGSGRHSPRNRYVASELNTGRMATLLFDLLTPDEELDRANVFDIELLAERLIQATQSLQSLPQVAGLPVGYFGASTGAAAALGAAADLGPAIAAVVSRGGRPDLAMHRLAEVTAPTLLIVGGRDQVVLELNRKAQDGMKSETRLEIVPGATHLFEEPGALESVAELARRWFASHLASP
jgi:putative phosphoribosyl transferase